MIGIDFTQTRSQRESCVRALLDRRDLSAAASVLGVTPGMSDEKNLLADWILADDPGSPDLLPLVRHLDPTRLAELAAASAGVPGRAELVLEISRHAPEVVRALSREFDDPRITEAILCDAPDEWMAKLRRDYERDREPLYVRAIAHVRTDRAMLCLIDAMKSAPDDHLGEFAVAWENAGIFYPGRTTSIYGDAFRGYVVHRDESPHHMGPGLDASVPLCLFCGTPSGRLLTLDAEVLGDDYELPDSPCFFWYQCTCDNGDDILVRHTDGGLEGVMTGMTDGPVESSLPATALRLEPFPRPSVVGGPARPGAGEHQVGGYPVWIDYGPFPSVPGVDRGMMFIASIDLAMTPLGQVTGQRGIIYCFFDDESRIAVSMLQRA